MAEGLEGGDDLLGGDEVPSEELGQFESSFPSVETQAQNEVRIDLGTLFRVRVMLIWMFPHSVLPPAVQSPAPALPSHLLDT